MACSAIEAQVVLRSPVGLFFFVVELNRVHFMSENKNMKKSKLHLKPKPTLRDFQKYVAKMVKERGFDKETIPQIFMLFLEECGEMAKAARKSQKIKSDKNSKEYHLDHEIADVFIYLLDICNHFGVDLEKAFREKEEINKKRVWE